MRIAEKRIGQISKQRGFGALGWLLVLSVAGFFLICAYKVVPAYIDNRYAVQALKSLANNNQDINELDKADIRRQISKFFTVNRVAKEVQTYDIVRRADRTLVNNVYEIRKPLIANIDVVIKFANQLDSSNEHECCDYLVEDEKTKKQ